jgi:D-alanine-D-alanine ligase
VGIRKIHNEGEYLPGLREAFQYDLKIILEEFIRGRELECSVLGNDTPVASVPGEVVPSHEFYSYEAKYLDERGAALEIPAQVPAAVEARIRELALKTFSVLCCQGLSRVDFFLRGAGPEDLLVNEINTMPGFTRISMYPKLWEEAGISYTELIDRLIRLAMERFEQEKGIRTTYLE